MYPVLVTRLRFGAIFLLFLPSCHGSADKSPPIPKPEPGTSKVIVWKGIYATSSEDRVGYFRDLASNLGLPILNGGTIGLTVRAWAWDSTKTAWVINLRTKHGKSACSILSYSYGKKDNTDYIYVHQQREVSPHSGWDAFWATLKQFQLPDVRLHKIPKDHLAYADGPSNILFEIDEPGHYSFIFYPDPAVFRSEDTACKRIDDFFRYFNQEMGTAIYDTGRR